jgi:hypothetical protein
LTDVLAEAHTLQIGGCQQFPGRLGRSAVWDALFGEKELSHDGKRVLGNTPISGKT